MRRFVFIAFFAAGPALAQSAQGDLAVTIYNDNLALVQDVRQLDIAGRPLPPGIPRRLRPDPPRDGDS